MPLPLFRRGYLVLAVIPAWGSSTREAFAQYDRQSGTPSMNAHQAEEELLVIYTDLMQGEKKVGLLPNDFLPLLCTNHPEYLRLFSLFDEGGATAWGLTGSGSGAFALLPDPSGFPSWQSRSKNMGPKNTVPGVMGDERAAHRTTDPNGIRFIVQPSKPLSITSLAEDFQVSKTVVSDDVAAISDALIRMGTEHVVTRGVPEGPPSLRT